MSQADNFRECQCCIEDRKKANKSARLLRQLPLEVTQDAELFKKVSLPVFVCEHCDGDDLIDSAIVTHLKRQTK